MSGLKEKQLFKSRVRAQGDIQYSESQLDSMFAAFENEFGHVKAGIEPEPADLLGTKISPKIADFNLNNLTLEEINQLSSNVTADDDQGWGPMGHLVGGGLWELINTAGFGLPGVLDHKDALENWLVYGDATPTMEEGTLETGFASSLGRTVGGLAGFMLPWAAGKAVVGAGAKGLGMISSTRAPSTWAVARNLTKESGDVFKRLDKIRPKAWGKLSRSNKKEVFEDVQKEVLNLGHTLEKTGIARANWVKNFLRGSKSVVDANLRMNNIRLTPSQLDDLMGRVHKVLNTSNESNLPIYNLQEWMAKVLGSVGGGGSERWNFIASALGAGVEEGVIFATVDTWINSMKMAEGKMDLEDLKDGAKHAMKVGFALGQIRLAPGGKSQPAMQPLLKKIMRQTKNERTFAYDAATETGRAAIAKHAKHFAEQGGLPLLNEKTTSKIVLSSVKDIDDLVNGVYRLNGASKNLTKEEGAGMLQHALDTFTKDWNKEWWSLFTKDWAQDMRDSSFRMLAGAVVNSFSTWTDDEIPIYDKWMSALIGAFIAKRGRELRYTDANGNTKVGKKIFGFNVGGQYKRVTYSDKFAKLDKLMNYTGDRTMAENKLFNAMLNEEYLKKSYVKGEETTDIKTIRDILEKNKLLVSVSEKPIIKSNSPVEGSHPTYEYLQLIFPVIAPEGFRIKNINEISKRDAKNIEKKLSEAVFEDVVGGKGIEFPSDFDDILIKSNKKSWEEVKDLHMRAIVQSYNEITGSKVEYEPGQEKAVIISDVKFKTLSDQHHQTYINYHAAARMMQKLGYLKINRVQNKDHAALDSKILSNVQTTLQTANQALNKIWFGKELIDKSQEVNVGDPISLSFMEYQGRFHGLEKNYRFLYDFSNKSGANWDKKPGSKDTDGEILEKLINTHFKRASDQLMYDRIIVGDGGNVELQLMVDALRMVMVPHPNSRNPFVYGTGGKHTMPLKDAKIIKEKLLDNGLYGFNFTNPQDLHIFVRDFNRYALDRRLKGGAKIVNGKAVPLMGRDRAIIQDFIETGVVNSQDFSYVDIIGTIDRIAALPQVTEVLGKMRVDRSTSMYAMNGAFKLDKLFANEPKIVDAFKKAAEKNNQDPNQFARDALTLYKNYIEPYKRTEDGQGLFQRGAVAEVEPGTLFQMVERLRLVEMQDMRNSHEQLMSTVLQYQNHAKYTDGQRAFLSQIMKQYFNKHRDTKSLLNILQKYELYKESTGEFDFSHADIKARIKLAQTAMEFITPNNISEASLKQSMIEFKDAHEAKPDGLDLFTTMTLDSFKKKYKVADDGTWDFDLNSAPEGFINAILKRSSIEVKDGEFIPFDTSILGDAYTGLKISNKKRAEIVNDAIQVYKNLQGRIELQRYSGVVGEGVLVGETSLARNSLFRFLNKDAMLGDKNYAIVDPIFITSDGAMNIHRNSKAMTGLRGELWNNLVQVDKTYKFEGLEAVRTDGRHYLVFMGDMGWGIAIPEGKANNIGREFYNYVKNAEQNLTGKDYERVVSELKKIRDNKLEIVETQKYDSNGKPVSGEVLTDVKFKTSDHVNDALYLQAMIQYMYLGDPQGLGRSWLKHANRDMKGGDPHNVVKINSRLRMLVNVSGIEFEKNYLKTVRDIYKEHLNTPENQSAISGLESLIKNDFNGILVRDENFKVGENPVFSLLKDAKDQISKEKNDHKGKEKLIFDEIKTNDNTGELEFNKASDSSLLDAVMIVRPSKFEAYSLAYGSGNIKGIGALKPIIAKLGADPMLGKTEMIKHEAFNNFFQAAENKNIDYIFVQSGNKTAGIHDYNYFEGFQTVKDLQNTRGFDNKFIINIPTKDISFSMVKNSNKEASLPHQLGNWHEAPIQKSIWNWLLDSHLGKDGEWGQVANRYYDPYNPLAANAAATHLLKSTDLSGFNRHLDYWLNAGGYIYSPVFASEYKNSLRSHFLDNNVMTMKSKFGTQAPLVPDLPGDARLRNTTFVTRDGKEGREIYSYGQIDAGFVSGSKKVETTRLSIIDHKFDAFDKLVSWGELSKNVNIKEAIKDWYSARGQSYDNIRNGETLLRVFNILKHINDKLGTNYEIATAVHRSPSTRPGDVPIVGIRSILPDGVGNQARLNSWDMKHRIEADFDIDIINYWWDTPFDVLNSWRKDAGKVDRVLPDAKENKTSLNYGSEKKIASWPTVDNLGSLLEHQSNVAHSEFMRGVITKTQRLMTYLKHYDSDIKGEGYQLKLGNLGGKVELNKGNWDKVTKELATDIQNIIDASTGFNKTKYGSSDGWLRNFLFGGEGYEGVFIKKTYNSQTSQFEGKHKIGDKVLQDVIIESLQPYRTFLQLGTGVFTNGQKQSVKYDNIISYVKSYDNSMATLSNKIFWKLRNKYGKGSDEALELQKLFEWDDRSRKIANPMFRSFGTNARPIGGKTKDSYESMLPFDRAMSTIAYKDQLSLGNINRHHGVHLEKFEQTIKSYETLNDATAALKGLVDVVKNDVTALSYLNFLEWKKRSLVDNKYSVVSNGNHKLGEYLEGKIGDLDILIKEAGERFMSSPEIAQRAIHQAAIRIRNEITTNFSNNKYKKFSTWKEAKSWVNKKSNQKLIYDHAKKQPFKFVGVHNEGHINSMAWGNILDMFTRMHINPERAPEWMQKMDQHVRTFKKMYYDGNRNLHGRGVKEPWMNAERLNNLHSRKLSQLFDYWNQQGMDVFGVKDGLGKLLLYKIMAPQQDMTTLAYFNGTMMPAYHKGSNGLIKLGLKFIASSNEMQIPEMHKRALFQYFANNNNYYHNLFYGRRLSKDFHELQSMEMIKEFNQSLFATQAPLLTKFDLGEKFTPRSIQETELNPHVGTMFGHDEMMSTGYILSNYPVSPRAVGEAAKFAERRYMPIGYVPNNFIGGYARISGWRSWNEAKRTEMEFLLGDLSKGDFLHVDVPRVAKVPFGESGSRIRKADDLRLINEEKATLSGDPNCK